MNAMQTDGQGRAGRDVFASIAWLAASWAMIAVTQLATYAHVSINWDEHTFIVMGQSVLDGSLPYVALFDIKPPVLYLAFAAILAVAGPSLIAVRLAGDVMLCLAALFVFLIARRLSGTTAAGMVTLVFAATTSFVHYEATTSGVMAIPLLLAGLFLLSATPARMATVVAAGLLISLAVLMRSNLGLVAVSLGLVLLVREGIGSGFGHGVRLFAAYAAAGIIPLLAVIFVYLQAGELDAFILGVVSVPMSYAEEQRSAADVAGRMVAFIDLARREAPLVTLPVLLLAGLGFAAIVTILAMGDGAQTGRRGAMAMVATALVTALCSILVGGAFYTHYFQQLLPLIAITAAPAIGLLVANRLSVVALVLPLAAVFGATHAERAGIQAVIAGEAELLPENPLRRAAAAIAADAAPGDAVWAAENHLVLWYMGRKPLSPAGAHPSNLARPAILAPLEDAGYVPPGELERILASRPAFVITKGEALPKYLRERGRDDIAALLVRDYDPFFRDEGVLVRRRKDQP